MTSILRLNFPDFSRRRIVIAGDCPCKVHQESVGAGCLGHLERAGKYDASPSTLPAFIRLTVNFQSIDRAIAREAVLKRTFQSWRRSLKIDGGEAFAADKCTLSDARDASVEPNRRKAGYSRTSILKDRSYLLVDGQGAIDNVSSRHPEKAQPSVLPEAERMRNALVRSRFVTQSEVGQVRTV